LSKKCDALQFVHYSQDTHLEVFSVTGAVGQLSTLHWSWCGPTGYGPKCLQLHSGRHHKFCSAL